MSTLRGTIIVCGGAGFIGSHFIRLMVKKHPKLRIVNFDKLTYAHDKRNIDIRGSIFEKGDISSYKDLERIHEKYAPTHIVNFAAETHVDRSIHGYASEFVRTNVGGVQTLLQFVSDHPAIKRYIQVSTDEVYGDTPVASKKTFSESSPLRPSSPYSASKAAGDLLCMAYFRTYKTPVIVTRGSNTYGPYQFPEKIIPFFILRMMELKKLPVYGTGKNVRDWMHVEDHCLGIETVLLKGKLGELYNISADQYRSNLDVTKAILKAFKRDSTWIEFVNDRPGHDLRYAPDAAKIKKELGWKAKIKFEEGIKKTIQYYLKDTFWLEKNFGTTHLINSHIK